MNTHDVLDVNCPSRRLLALLADKWVLLIVIALSKHEPMRNGELKRKLGNISQKMLIQTLKELEQSGLVERTAYPEVPPRVEYRLTEIGHSLLEPIGAIRIWAEENVSRIEALRDQPA
jgi:DNA-binding HxlR family transcriptional regulator